MVLWDDLRARSLLVDEGIGMGVYYGSFIAVSDYNRMLYKRQSAPGYADKGRLYSTSWSDSDISSVRPSVADFVLSTRSDDTNIENVSIERHNGITWFEPLTSPRRLLMNLKNVDRLIILQVTC